MKMLGCWAHRLAAPWLSALAHTNFRRVWFGQFVSQLGSSAQVIGASYFLKEATESATFVGLVLSCAGLVGLACLPVAGVCADRYSRRRIVLYCDVFSGVVLLAVVLGFAACSPGKLAPMAYGVAGCLLALRAVAAFFRPAFGAILPDLVPRENLTTANSLYKTGGRVGELLGSVFGGLIYAQLGPAKLFLVDALSYGFSAICMWRTRADTPHAAKAARRGRQGLIAEMLAGFLAISRVPGGKAFLSMALVINFFATPIFVLMPFHVARTLHGGATLFGTLMGALTCGVLIGYLVAGWRSASAFQGRYCISVTIVAMCAAFIVFAVARDTWLALVALLCAGVANGYWSIFFETALQGAVERAVLGRVYAAFGILSGGAVPIAALVGGCLLDLLSQETRALFVCCASFMTIYAVILAFSRPFNDFFQYLRCQTGLSTQQQ